MYSHVPTHVGTYGTQQTKMSLKDNVMWFAAVRTTIVLSVSSVDRPWLNNSTRIPLLALCSSSLNKYMYTTIQARDMYNCSRDGVIGCKG